MIETVNERATPLTPITFKDENGDPVIPTLAYYRIDDVGSGDEIRAETEIEIDSPASATVNLRWTQSDTQILDQSHAYETREMTVRWIYGSESPANQGTEHVFIYIKNLGGIPSQSPA